MRTIALGVAWGRSQYKRTGTPAAAEAKGVKAGESKQRNESDNRRLRAILQLKYRPAQPTELGVGVTN